MGLFTRVRSVTVGPGACRVRPVPSGTVREKAWRGAESVRAVGAGMILDGETWGRRLSVEPLKEGEPVTLNGRPYRGRIELLSNAGGQITAVNVLPLDDYVRGILVREVSPKWPAEALKAQAVVSRTYAHRNRGRHGSQGYDFCPEPHCQAYGGFSSEQASTNAAVEKTRDQVLLYRDQTISAVFHSCCGGSTDGSEDVWKSRGQPYLRAVRCRHCRDSAHYRWTADVDGEGLSGRLAGAGHRVGRIKAIRILSRSEAGRAYEVGISGTEGEAALKANEFRLLADGRLLRSTYWSGISRHGGTWRFHGRGWGHGVGLCQWGTKELAGRGFRYKDILDYYYRKVRLKRIEA